MITDSKISLRLLRTRAMNYSHDDNTINISLGIIIIIIIINTAVGPAS